MTFLHQKLEPLRCRPPDELTLTRIGYLRPFIRQSNDSIRPRWEMGNRKLLDFLAVYIHTGHGVFTLEDEVFELKAGDLFWVPPDTLHSMRGDSEKMHCVYLHFDLLYDPTRSHWDAVIPAGMLDLSDYRQLMHPPLYDAEINLWRGKIPLHGHHDRILELMRKMCRIHHQSPVHSLELAGMMLGLLELIGMAAAPASGGPSHRDALARATAYMEQRYQDPALSIAAIARHCGFSHTHFRRLFKSNFGVTPLEYLRNIRNCRARELLIFTRLGIGEIAAEAGFGSIYNFSRAFRQQNGIAPLQFRHDANLQELSN